MSFAVAMMIGGQLIVYPGAYHAFDISSLQTPVTYFGHHLEFNNSATAQSTDTLHEFLRSMVGDHQ
jgi:dienelactone hydrolase